MPTVVVIFVTLFGACLGSFLNVVIYRLPLSLSVISPGSFCPNCKKPIKFWENIPILSFIILRGRCSGCKMPISFQYPLVEALTALLTMALWLRFYLSPGFFLYLYFAYGLIVVGLIDLNHLLIPDLVIIIGIFLGLVLNMIQARIIFALLGMVAAGGLILLVRTVGSLIYRKEVMGLGDIEVSAMLGAYLGIKYALISIFIAALLGSLIGGLYLILARKDRQTPIPFGLFLSAGGLLALFIEGLDLWFLNLNFIR